LQFHVVVGFLGDDFIAFLFQQFPHQHFPFFQRSVAKSENDSRPWFCRRLAAGETGRQRAKMRIVIRERVMRTYLFPPEIKL
jgi:hypothetical protein